MQLDLHLCGPKGDGSRILLDHALAMVQLDNEFVIQAMLRAGRPVPDLIDQLGIPYRDDTVLDPDSDYQAFYGLRAMLERGSWSCGDAAPFEAAVLKCKHRVPARAFARYGTEDGFWHAVYETPRGTVDPVARFIREQTRRAI